MNYQLLLEKVNEYALHYFKTHDTDKFTYHNKQHTQDVVKAAEQIADHYQLNDHDFFIVSAAAWFHDLGYMVDINNHEEQGIVIAEKFLKDQNALTEDIEAIAACIRATKMPQSPANLLAQIVCDADLFHLGTDEFFKKDKLLLKEYNELHHADLSKLQWRQKTIKFLETHHYYTDYCKLLLTSCQEQNLEILKQKVANAIAKLNNNQKEENAKTELITPMHQEKDQIIEKAKKKDRPEKGIETMFRISSSNHQRLSDMADNKAHIMITVNSIILSAIISLLLRKLSESPYLIIPTVVLLTVSLLAMTFSILATRPSIPAGTFTREDVDNKNVNLLFFGNFYKMPMEDYNYGMRLMMEDKEFLYGSLIKDVYAQGVVLGKKYRLLRAAYNIFMFGLIIAVLAFIIASAFYGNKPS